VIQESKNKINIIWSIALITNVALIVILYAANNLIGIDSFSNYISLPLYVIIPGVLVLLSILALSQSHKIKELTKWPLFFLVLSFSASLAAEQTWNLYEHVLDIDPYPSIADLFYLSAPLLMFVSLVLFLRPISHKIKKRSILFAVMISFAVLIPSIIITFNASAEDEPIEIIIALAYPIVDSILLVPAIIAILFSIKGKKNFFWLMILAGIIVVLVADTLFLFLIIDDSYTDGHPVDILWITSYTIWAFMMYYILYNSRKNNSDELKNIYEKYTMEKFQKVGVVVTLVLVNISMAIILISMNSLIGVSAGSTSLSYFSWVLMTIMVIFSGIIVILNSKLNNLLQRRTQVLEKTTEDLIKAERFSAIGEVSAKISHDIRNPLNAIKISTNIISIKTKEIEELKIDEHIDIINQAIARIVHQVDEVLGFLKTRKKRLENNSLDDIVNDSLKDLEISEQLIIKKDILPISFVSDYFQIQTVLTNIILNAIQALENKGKITISGKIINTDVVVEISDSGKGISEKNIKNIFKPLFTTKQTGTGLGLSSCQTIIESHNGSITYSNNPSTFKIIIPQLKMDKNNA
jgi:signal transduction histidine kinase